MSSRHVLIKSESGEITVLTPIQVFVDGDHKYSTTLSSLNAVFDYIGSRAGADSALQDLVSEGGTEQPKQCVQELETDVIPGAPTRLRSALLELRGWLQGTQEYLFVTDGEQADEEATEKSVVEELVEIKKLAKEMVKSERRT